MMTRRMRTKDEDGRIIRGTPPFPDDDDDDDDVTDNDADIEGGMRRF
jgi:hypothetical protein